MPATTDRALAFVSKVAKEELHPTLVAPVTVAQRAVVQEAPVGPRAVEPEEVDAVQLAEEVVVEAEQGTAAEEA